MTDGWRMDDDAVRALRSAVARGDSEVTGLLKQAASMALGGDPGTEELPGTERRLGDRVLGALNLALDQDNLEVAEHLVLAFESAMTRFGGPGAVEQRDVPAAMASTYLRLEELRRRRYGG